MAKTIEVIDRNKMKTTRLHLTHIIYIIVMILLVSGCAHHFKVDLDKRIEGYVVADQADSLIRKHAPVFLAYEAEHAFNQIGKVSVKTDEDNRGDIFIDTNKPIFYTMVREFETDKGKYRNLIYRVHFPGIPYRIIPFHLTAGKNVGLMVVITLDSNERPVLVTTVHTCGCYMAIVPTTHLPKAYLPEKWPQGLLKVYGEKLPSMLNYDSVSDPAVVIHLRNEVHRVMDLQIKEKASIKNRSHVLRDAQIEPMEDLEKINVNGSHISFYYSSGLLNGHVKGSVKPWETLLLSLISLDLFVGTDKVYGDSRETGNEFYTSLKPWNRKVSDMWNFSRFLKFWGWRL